MGWHMKCAHIELILEVCGEWMLLAVKDMEKLGTS